MNQLLEKILEATVATIQRKQKSITRLFPSFPDRVKAVADKGGVRLDRTAADLWKFRVHSGTQGDVWYDVILRFKNVVPTLERLVKNRRLWTSDKTRVDLRKLAREFLNRVDVEILCSCPAFQYWGPAYILSLSKYDAKYTDKETRPPRIRNPKKYGAYCKHYANVMRVLPFYKTTLAKWLRDFYRKEIARFEEEAKKELGGVKKAAAALGKRKEGQGK